MVSFQFLGSRMGVEPQRDELAARCQVLRAQGQVYPSFPRPQNFHHGSSLPYVQQSQDLDWLSGLRLWPDPGGVP